jgi:methylene-tetrahydromethanopterin dehydrogenase
MVACVEKQLKDRHGVDWTDRKVVVFGATGVVGFAAGVIAAAEGAAVDMVGYDGITRVTAGAADAKARFGVGLTPVDGSSEALKTAAVRQAEVVFCAGRAGVQVLGPEQLAAAPALTVAADINAVPPAGIAGVGMQDDGAPLAGTPGVGIGPLTIGGVKYQVESGLIRQMIDTDRPLYLDFRDAFKLARKIVG